MKNSIVLSILGLVLFACVPEKSPTEVTENPQFDDDSVKIEQVEVIEEPEIVEAIDSVVQKSGLRIKWYKHGEGDLISDGEVVRINYAVFLEDGKKVDGNNQLGKPFPFMVGFGMQTKGWDVALRQLKAGDSVEIFLPSDLARGEKGIPGHIPPNSSNIIRLGVVENMQPSRELDGNKVWIIAENPTEKNVFKDTTNQIDFHCMTSTPTNSMYVNTFASGEPFSTKLKDAGLVPGLKKALINAKTSDRMYVYVPSSEAYGSKGLKGMVKRNEDLFYNIMVMDVR